MWNFRANRRNARASFHTFCNWLRGDGQGEPEFSNEDGRGYATVVGNDPELPGIGRAFPRPTRSSWRPPIQLTKGDDPHSDHNTESGFAT